MATNRFAKTVQIIRNSRCRLYFDNIIPELKSIVGEKKRYAWSVAPYSGENASSDATSEGENLWFEIEEVEGEEVRGVVTFPEDSGSLANVQRRATLRKDEKEKTFFFDFKNVDSNE